MNKIEYFYFDATKNFLNQINSKEIDLTSVIAKICAIALPIFAILEAIFDLLAFPIIWAINLGIQEPTIPPINLFRRQEIATFQEVVELIEAGGEKRNVPDFLAKSKEVYFKKKTWNLAALTHQIEFDVLRLRGGIFLNGNCVQSSDEIYRVLGLEKSFLEQPSTSSPTKQQQEALEFLCLMQQGFFGGAVTDLHNLAISKVPGTQGQFACTQGGTEAQHEVLRIISTVRGLQDPNEYLISLFHWLSINTEVEENIFTPLTTPSTFPLGKLPKVCQSEEFLSLLFHAIQEKSLPENTIRFFKEGISFKIPYDLHPTRILAFYGTEGRTPIRKIFGEQDYALVEIAADEIARQPLLIHVTYQEGKAVTSWQRHPSIPALQERLLILPKP